MKTLIALLCMSTAALAGERATVVVCPSHLDYCYRVEKPILPQMRLEDRQARDEKELQEIERQAGVRRQQVDAAAQWSSDSLGAALARSTGITRRR